MRFPLTYATVQQSLSLPDNEMGSGIELMEAFIAHSHITCGSVSLSNHKVPARPIVPCRTEGTTNTVLKINVSKIVGPVLNCEPVLARLEKGLRGSTSKVDNGCADSNHNSIE